MRRNRKAEVIFWSIALPGFGQYLNGKFAKGTVFIVLEFLVNVNSGLNGAILTSFHGNIHKAIALVDFQWLMFYPCLYIFAMWDAYRDAGGRNCSLFISSFCFFSFYWYDWSCLLTYLKF